MSQDNNSGMDLRNMKPSTVFEKRSGTTDHGKDYEHLYIANLVLNLVVDDTVEDFYLSSNNEQFGSFDDVVVEIKYAGSEELVVYAIQLKHCKSKVLKIRDLAAPKGNFSLNKYFCENAFDPRVKMILFTNCKSQLQESIEVKLKTETVNLELLECEQTELLKTSDKGICYRFKSNRCEKFFQNLFVYTNQANVEMLRKRILNSFRKIFDGDVDIFRKYVDFITQWSLKEGKKNKLDKRWIKEQLFILLSSPFIKPLTFSLSTTVGIRGKVFRDAISKFGTIFLHKQNYEIVKYLWQDVFKKTDIGPKINEVEKKYFPTLQRVQNKELDGENKEINQLLWLLRKCPLIVEGSPQIYKAIKVCTTKNIIILDDSEHLEMQSTFENLSDLKSDKEIYKKIIKNFTFSIEGQMETPLRHLLELNEDLEMEITVNQLARMIEGPLQIGSQREELPPCHIERKLTKIVIDFQFLKKLRENTIIIISQVEDISWVKEKVQKTKTLGVDQITDEDNVVYVSNNKVTDELFRNISSENPLKYLHYFRYLNKTCLEWVKSVNWGNVPQVDQNNGFEELNKFRIENENTDDVVHESEIFCGHENNINIVCANPGMGKSTIAKSLKNNCSSEMWTIVIYARNHGQHFRKFGANMDEFFKHILSEKLTQNATDYKNLTSFLVQNRIRLIWDGLDEVSEDTLRIILSLIEAISRRSIKQWLTSRNNLKNQLERRFNTFARDLKQFDEQEQKVYIRDRLNVSASELSEIFPKIKLNIQMCSNNDILGIPLQIFMLTELLHQNREKYLVLLDGFFSILDLYQHFVIEQFKIFFEGKRNQSLNNDKNLESFENEKKNQLKCYQKIACHIYLKGRLTKTFTKWLSLGSKCDKFIKKVTSRGDEVGLIKQATNFDDVVFMHNSYGEYFAALYLFENNRQKARDPTFISNEKFRNIRFFLDLMLVQNSKSIAAILCRNYTLFEKCSKEDFNVTDLIGREVLELSCAWNKKFPILRLKKNSEFEFNPRLNEKNATVLNYKDIKKHFEKIDKCVDVSQRKFLLFFPFLIPFFDEARQDFDPDYLPSILNYAIKLDNTLLFDLIQNSVALKYFYDNRIKPESLLSSALNWKSRKILDKIILDGKFRLLLLTKLRDFLKGLSQQHEEMFRYLINLQNYDGKMPIHYVCANSDFESTEWLIARDSKLDVFDTFDQLPIHYACQVYNFEIVKLLLNQNSGVNIPDKDNLLPIHYACEKYNFEIVQLLVNRGSIVNIPDKNDLLPIHYACHKYEFKIVELILNQSSKVNIADKNGLLPIHYACEKYNFELIKLLLDRNSQVNIPDSNGLLPIDYACEKRRFEIVKLLLDHNSKVNNPGKNDLMPIHYACRHKKGHGLVKLLLDKGSKIDVPDVNGVLPIHYACNSTGGYEIVKLLLENGARVDVRDSNGALPIHYACKSERGMELVSLLLEKGARIDIPDFNDVLPMHLACKYEYSDELLNLFLENGARIDVPNWKGVLPIHYACENWNSDKTVKLLLEKDARIDIPDANGAFPMHYACRNKIYGYEILKLLLEKDAKVDVPDLNGLLPMHYACRNNLYGYDIAQLLTEKGVNDNSLDANGVIPTQYILSNHLKLRK